MTAEQERWAEALAIDRMHGADSDRWIKEQIERLAEDVDVDGVERLMEIAARLNQLQEARQRPQ